MYKYLVDVRVLTGICTFAKKTMVFYKMTFTELSTHIIPCHFYPSLNLYMGITSKNNQKGSILRDFRLLNNSIEVYNYIHMEGLTTISCAQI